MEMRDLIELENDIVFQQLNQEVNSFNTLKVLRLENYEIRHSNLLAWLLDPMENHQLYDYFLRKTIEHLILIDENSDNLQYEEIGEILNHSLMNSYVYREVKTDNNRFIDLLIVSKQSKLVILIENKFYSTESENQLDDYLHFVQHIFNDFTIIPIYLTLNGEKPSNHQYFILTYERIQSILQTILTVHKNQLSEDVYNLIEDYNIILKEKYNPNQDQILQAIDIYRQHKSTIDSLFEETAIVSKELQLKTEYKHHFVKKYKHTIEYIFKHGQNILAYSFEQFIQQQFDTEILYRPHPTVPHLLPPEWHGVSRFHVREPNYWLGTGLIVWFEQTKDRRLRLIAEIGPIKYVNRLSLLEQLENIGLSFSERSKSEESRYTRFYSNKLDINKWNDTAELTQAMIELYNDPEFTLLRHQLADILNSRTKKLSTIETNQMKNLPVNETNRQVQTAFKKWMALNNIPEDHYRVSKRNLSFKIPLFDQFKEQLGETREKWWWDNGPFLFWININPDLLYFVLEVGPIEADKRISLMQRIEDKGIKVSKKALTLKAKYNRIYTKAISIEGLTESELLDVFETLYTNKDIQNILEKLQMIYKDILVQDNDGM